MEWGGHLSCLWPSCLKARDAQAMTPCPLQRGAWEALAWPLLYSCSLVAVAARDSTSGSVHWHPFSNSDSSLQSGQFNEDMIPTVGFNMRKITKGNVTIKVSGRKPQTLAHTRSGPQKSTCVPAGAGTQKELGRGSETRGRRS